MSPQEAAAQLDSFVALVRQTERDRIALWLVDGNADLELISSLPHWRAVVWALLHPVRFEVASVTAQIGVAINRGEHALTPPGEQP